MPVNPAAMNALMTQYASMTADLDDSENRSRINYNNAINELRRRNTQGMGQIGVRSADSGMAQSGIRGQTMMKQQDEFNRASALRAQQQELALSTIARKRLALDAERRAQEALLLSGLQ